MKTWLWILIIAIVGVAAWLIASSMTKKKMELQAGSGGIGYGMNRFGTPSRGGIWNCIDANGNIYKSNSPCPKQLPVNADNV